MLSKDPLIGSSLFASGLSALDPILDPLSICIFKGTFQKEYLFFKKSSEVTLEFQSKDLPKSMAKGLKIDMVFICLQPLWVCY